MKASLNVGAILFAVLVASGSVLAATMHGDVRFAEGARLEGDLRASADAGIVDLTEALEKGERVELAFTSAKGYQVSHLWNYFGPPGYSVFAGSSQENVSVERGAGLLHGLACAEGTLCEAILFVDAGEGDIASSGGRSGHLRPSGVDHEYAAVAHEPTTDNFYHRAPATWLSLSGADECIAGSSAKLAVAGRAGLYLKNVTGELVTSEGTFAFSTVTRTTPQVVAGREVASKTESSFLVLQLAGTSFEASGSSLAHALVPRASVDLVGRLLAESASGHVMVDGERHELDEDLLTLGGNMSFDVSASDGGLLAAAPAPLTSRAFAQSRVSGDAEHVQIAGRIVRREESAPSTALLGTGLAVLLLAAIAGWKTFGAAALYMRIERAGVLQNMNRARVHDAIRANPGVGLAGLVRATGLASVVVRHHLRMLEAHHMVSIHSQGTARAYFAADGPKGGEYHAYLVLRDAKRTQLASLLVGAAGGLSQRQLTERTGLPQRRISYHLALLESSGLVTNDGAMPRRYVATPALREVAVAPAAAASAEA